MIRRNLAIYYWCLFISGFTVLIVIASQIMERVSNLFFICCVYLSSIFLLIPYIIPYGRKKLSQTEFDPLIVRNHNEIIWIMDRLNFTTKHKLIACHILITLERNPQQREIQFLEIAEIFGTSPDEVCHVIHFLKRVQQGKLNKLIEHLRKRNAEGGV